MSRSMAPFPHLPKPEPGSLQDLILQQPRKRLYTHPSIWETEHLKLLNCPAPVTVRLSCACFSGSPPMGAFLGSSDRVIANTIHSNLQGTIKTEEKDFATRKLIRFLTASIKRVDPPNQRQRSPFRIALDSDLAFFYGCKKVAYIPCAVLAWDTKPKARTLAFLDDSWRQAPQSKPRKGRLRPPKHHMSAKALENRPVYPYHVAILIALAQDFHQKHRSHISQAKVNLLTPSKERDSLVLYTAVVSHEYIQKFSDPRKFHGGDLFITKLEVPMDRVENVINVFNHILGGCRGSGSLAGEISPVNSQINADGKQKHDEKSIVDKIEILNQFLNVNFGFDIRAEEDA